MASLGTRLSRPHRGGAHWLGHLAVSTRRSICSISLSRSCPCARRTGTKGQRCHKRPPATSSQSQDIASRPTSAAAPLGSLNSIGIGLPGPVCAPGGRRAGSRQAATRRRSPCYAGYLSRGGSCHRVRRLVFLATERCQVEQVVRAEQHVEAARVGGVRCDRRRRSRGGRRPGRESPPFGRRAVVLGAADGVVQHDKEVVALGPNPLRSLLDRQGGADALRLSRVGCRNRRPMLAPLCAIDVGSLLEQDRETTPNVGGERHGYGGVAQGRYVAGL